MALMAEIKLCAVTDVPPGTGKQVNAGGKVIAVFNVGGAFHAIQGICPHRGGPLGEGTVAGTNVTCPWHAWTFDVCTGNRAGFPEGLGKIATYKVRIEGEEVFVEW
jgi:nitrite reductase/ring-hydroxylating ferredoxin subunit